MPDGFILTGKDWTLGSLLALCILAILFGFLDTRWSVNKKLNMMTNQVDEAVRRENYCRDALAKSQETIILQQKQIGELMEQGKTTLALLASLEASASMSRGGSGRHNAPG